MKFLDKKWKKALAITAGILLGLIILIIAFISPIAKYLIEKYDEKYLGRQITLDWIYVNPFTGYAHIDDFKLYEPSKDSVFVSFSGLSIDFAMLKLIGKTYQIDNLTINKPEIRIIQNRQDFNFNDLIERFTPKDTTAKDTVPLHFNILDVKIKGGKFFYIEQAIPVNYWITDLDIETPGKRWNVDTVLATVKLKSGPGTGDVKLDANFNLKTMDYKIKALVTKFDLSIFEQYLKDLANYGRFRANLDCDVSAEGNVNNQLDMKAKGYLAINDFHFGKSVGDDYVSLKKLALNMNNISPMQFEYDFDTIAIVNPYFKFERYDYLDNVQRMFGVGGSEIKEAQADSSKFNLILEIADFVEVIGRNFVKSHYRATKFALYNGDIHFNDYSIREKFAIAASPLNILAKDIDKNNKRINVGLSTDLQPHGKVQFGVSVNPQGIKDFDINYAITEIALPDVNPYVVTYTSFPFKSGTLEFKGKWFVRDSIIESMNHLIILNPQLMKRVKKKDAKWLPLPLIMSIVREPGNYIDYEIPVRGNLNDPKIKVGDIILDIVRNIFVKPPTFPYRSYVKTQKVEVENHQIFRWNMHQTNLSEPQQKFVEKIAKFMKGDAETQVYIAPVEYTVKEKEHLLYYEAKKKYYLMANNKKASAYTEEDSIDVEKMSVKDSMFIKVLDKNVEGSDMMFTLMEKCIHWIDTSTVNRKLDKLSADRKKAFMAPFTELGIAANRLKFSADKSETPRTGFSYYKISYDGDIPDQLRKALENLDEDVEKVLTPGSPRNKLRIRDRQDQPK